MLKHVMIDKQNNWAVTRGDIVFLWEPHKCDKLYHLAVLFDSIPDGGGLYNGGKAVFLESGKIYDVSEIDHKCAFRKQPYEHVSHALWNNSQSFSFYLDRVATASKYTPDNVHKFIKDYLTKVGREDLVYIFDNGHALDDQLIPMRKVLDLAEMIEPMQKEAFEKKRKIQEKRKSRLQKKYTNKNIELEQEKQ